MTKVIVFHRFYGCETGCCGHAIATVDNDDFEERHGSFAFNHPYGEDHREFAERWVTEEMGPEHVKDLDWENCIIEED